MDEVDVSRKLFDVVFFDGGSNFQKAGELLTIHYPWLSVIHGADHATALFFTDVSKLKEMKFLLRKYSLIFNIFGGGRHRPYAILTSFVKKALHQQIGLIK